MNDKTTSEHIRPQIIRRLIGLSAAAFGITTVNSPHTDPAGLRRT
ncbi:hypothetical protein [Paucibacter sp. KBW04]|nr:hypothetical protein [Paucibacter sp. KBW04]